MAKYQVDDYLGAKDAIRIKMRLRDKPVKKVKLSYANVPIEENEWVDFDKFLPINYDLCRLKLKDGGEKIGWWGGQGWDGYRLKEEDEVTHWKRKEYPNFG